MTDLSRRPDATWLTRRRELLPVPVERVWRALTQPDELAKWWCDEATVDLTPGGTYRFTGRSVFGRPDAIESPGDFEVLDVDENERLEYRWFVDGVETTVTYELTSELEETALVVTQRAAAAEADSPGWEGSDDGPNWWWVALPALRSTIEAGAPRLRLDYERVGSGPLRFATPIATFPWAVQAKLLDAAELRRWWDADASIDARAGGDFRFGERATGPRTVISLDDEPHPRLVHDWRWRDGSETRVEWTIEATDDDTIITVCDECPPPDRRERVRRAVYWSSALLHLAQLSARGSSPSEYQDFF